MIITNKFIFLQLQKSASTQVRNIILNLYPNAEKYKKHNQLNFETDKKIIGSIRNPFSWYVSLFAYGCKHAGGLYKNATKKRFSELGTNIKNLNFKGAFSEITRPVNKWKKLYEDPNNISNFKKWLKLLFSRKSDLPKIYFHNKLSDFAGFYTFRYCRLYFKNFSDLIEKINNFEDLYRFNKDYNLLDYIIRVESLEDDLISTLIDLNELTKERERFIIESKEKIRNKSNHLPYSLYYDEDSIKLIKNYEKFLLDKYNYQIDSKS